MIPNLDARPIEGAPRLPANSLDFLRFAFASLVVFSHSYPLATGTEDREPLKVLTVGQITFGALAVDCFFVISGFLILHSWLARPAVVPYLRKRVLRIYPGFLIIAVLDAFFIAPLFSRDGFQSIDAAFVWRFVGNALRLVPIEAGPSFPDNPAPGPVNGSLWSISYEFWCYIGILVLGVSGAARSRRGLLVGWIASIAVALAFAWSQWSPGGKILGAIFGYPPFWARLLPYFLAGMVFYSYRNEIRFTAAGAAAAIVALAVASRIPYGLIVVLPAASAYLIFGFAFAATGRLSRFADRGDFSYGIYLYAFPLLQIVAHVGGGALSALGLFAIGWPLSIVAAVLSWHLVEKRCLALAHPKPRLSGAATRHA